MLSDSAPPPPTYSCTEIADEEGPRSVAEAWYNRHRTERVPAISLERDPGIKDQNFVCYSLIRPNEYGAVKHASRAGDYKGNLIKFRGCFATQAAAEAHIEKLMRRDPHFDIHLIKAGEWSLMDNDQVEQHAYVDPIIADVMKGYFKNEDLRLKSMQERIRSVEDPGADNRSLEASRFFEACQIPECGETMETTTACAEPEEPEETGCAKTTTLSDLVSELELKPPKSRVLQHEPMNDNAKQALVAEYILD